MAELVDAQVSGTCEGFFMKVQVLSGAPSFLIPANAGFFIAKIENYGNGRDIKLIIMFNLKKIYYGANRYCKSKSRNVLV